MKKILFILLLLFAVNSQATVDERLSDVYFANGIDTLQEDAEKIRDKLQDLTEIEKPESFKSIANWKVSYNKTKGFQQDIYETSIQALFVKLDNKDHWAHTAGAVVWIVDTVMGLPGVKDLVKGAIYFGGKKIVKEELKDLLLDEVKRTFAKKGLKLTNEEIEFLSDVLFDELLDNLLSGPLDETRDDINKDVGTQALAYAESISLGHGVIIVAHCQGNFYTNFVVEEKMETWTKQYFNVLGVATPTSSIVNGGPHLTFNNDVIQVVPEHLSANIQNPKHYYIENAIGEKVETFVSVEAHSFLSSYMETSMTRDAVLEFIDDSVNVHKTIAPSQWKKSKEIGCLCKDKYIMVEHKFVDSLNHLMEGLRVLPFDEEGKLYPLGFNYVKGSPEGENVIEVEESDTCFELTDKNESVIGTISSITGGSVTPKNGAVTVSLNWEDPEIDLDLDVQWAAGTHDIKDVSCRPTEHFYIDDIWSIYPGRYPVYVNNPGGADASLLPETIQIGIKVPGEYQSYTVKVATADELNLGHVADISIEYVDNQVVVKAVPTTYVSESFNNYTKRTNNKTVSQQSDSEEDDGGRYVGSGEDFVYYSGWRPASECTESCGCIPCQYEIIPYLQQVVLGPLAGADVGLYVASDYGSSGPIFTADTSIGNTLYSAGLVDMNESFKATLDDNELYIFSVSGGSDIDADDDFAIDAVATENRGTIHAVLTGKEIKEVGFKVNILTEIAYQVTKDMYGGGASNEEILAKLDEVATLLLKDKIYSDSNVPLGHTDLLVWLPTIDRALLFVDYAASIQPIIESIYNDEDIYNAAYNVVYYPNGIAVGAPRLASSILYVNEHATAGTTVGNVSIYSEGDSSITSMALSGEGSENFLLTGDGTITVSSSADLDFEKQQIYKLSVTATNDSGTSAPVTLYVQLNNIVDVPVATSFVGYQLLDTAPVGTLVGVITFDEGAAAVSSIRLSGEGSEYFVIDTEGHITVGADGFAKLNEGLSDYREKTSFSLSVVATNAMGESLPAKLGLEVYHVRETPTLIPLRVNVDENTPAFSILGSIDFNEGNSPVSEFVLTGNGSENFSIDLNGQITVTEGAILDYETTTVYKLQAIATNAFGSSQSTAVTINVRDLPELPTLKPISAAILNHTEAGAVVGTLAVHDNGGPISAIYLSGDGYEDFLIDTEGVITVSPTANLDYMVRSEYKLYAQAVNSQGSSESVEVNIRVTSGIHTQHVDPFGDGSSIVIHPLDDQMSLQGTELTGTPLFSDISKFGRSVYLDPSRGCLSFGGTQEGDFTMSAWVKPQQAITLLTESTTGMQYYYSSYQSEVFYPNYGGSYSSQRVGVGLSVGTNGVVVPIHKGFLMTSLLTYSGPINEWDFITVTVQNGTPKLYINGVFMKEGLQAPYSTLHPNSLSSCGYTRHRMTGYIDQISIFNRVLLDEEIEALYHIQ